MLGSFDERLGGVGLASAVDMRLPSRTLLDTLFVTSVLRPARGIFNLSLRWLCTAARHSACLVCRWYVVYLMMSLGYPMRDI